MVGEPSEAVTWNGVPVRTDSERKSRSKGLYARFDFWRSFEKSQGSMGDCCRCGSRRVPLSTKRPFGRGADRRWGQRTRRTSRDRRGRCRGCTRSSRRFGATRRLRRGRGRARRCRDGPGCGAPGCGGAPGCNWCPRCGGALLIRRSKFPLRSKLRLPVRQHEDLRHRF